MADTPVSWRRTEPPPVASTRYGVPVTGPTLTGLGGCVAHLMCARGRRATTHTRTREWVSSGFDTDYGLASVTPNGLFESFSFLLPLADRARHLVVALDVQAEPETTASTPGVTVALRDPALTATQDRVFFSHGPDIGGRRDMLADGTVLYPRRLYATPWQPAVSTALDRAPSPLIVPGSARGTMRAIEVVAADVRVWQVHVWERFERLVEADP